MTTSLRRIALVSLLCCSIVGSARAEGPLLASGRRAAAALQTPATDSGRTLTRAGVGVVGAGGVLMILGATVIKSKTEEYEICRDLVDDFGLSLDCDNEKTWSKPAVVTGAVVAGIGVGMLTAGVTRATLTIAPANGGIVVSKTARW